MEFKPCTITFAIDPGYNEGPSMTVEGLEAVGTGLGYFIDEKPKAPEWAFSVNDIQVYREPDATRYCPTHLSSGMGFPLWFYEEEHVRAFIEEMSTILDWNLPLEEIKKLPQWASLYQKNNEVAQRVTVVTG